MKRREVTQEIVDYCWTRREESWSFDEIAEHVFKHSLPETLDLVKRRWPEVKKRIERTFRKAVIPVERSIPRQRWKIAELGDDGIDTEYMARVNRAAGHARRAEDMYQAIVAGSLLDRPQMTELAEEAAPAQHALGSLAAALARFRAPRPERPGPKRASRGQREEPHTEA